jgi:hypothetical protein
MNKLSILGLSVGTVLLCTMPISLQLSRQDNLSVSLDKANARIGQPATPGSVAGVHRRVYRRTARRGYYGAAVGAAAVGAAAVGTAAAGSYYEGAPLYNAAAAPEPVVAAPPAVAAPEAPGQAGADFALIQFDNARCEVWQNSADNPPWGTGWTRLAVGIPDRDLAEAAYHSARAQGVCH